MDLIFVSMENWDEIWRRNQFVCAELARRFPDSKILFVGLPRDISNQIRRGLRHAPGADSARNVPDYPQITITRPIKLAPNTLAIGRWFNNLISRIHVSSKARESGLKSPILWLNPHSSVHMAGGMSSCATIYDITDDWISLTQAEATRQLTIVQDRELCQRADAVIVCSQRLFDLKRPLAQNLHLIPNGVDFEHYRCVLNGSGPLPKACANWEHPVLGYTGTIHPDRVDIDLIQRLANAMSVGSVALVGPSQLLDPDRQGLEATGRVHFTGQVPYADVPQYMRAFDVCITPHLVTDFTESLNPIKLWEYLAGGKPIVSTPVAGFRDYPQFVRIASTGPEFLNAINDALNEPSTAAEERRSEAIKHSWVERVDRMLEVFEQAKAAHLASR